MGPVGPSRAATTTALAALAVATLLAACSSGSSSTSSGSGTTAGGTAGSTAGSGGETTIGVDLTYNSTAFWAAYINYESQYAKQLHIKLLGPLLAAANASLQNTQIENLVNEGAKAIIVNPETATSLGPAINYAAAHHVQLVSVDTIVGVGHVYMVVRASNTLYGQDACAYISSKVKSGYVLDLEGDLTSSNGADRTDAFNSGQKNLALIVAGVILYLLGQRHTGSFSRNDQLSVAMFAVVMTVAFLGFAADRLYQMLMQRVLAWRE